MNQYNFNFQDLPLDSQAATKYVMEYLLHKACPFLQQIRYKIQAFDQNAAEEDIVKIRDVFMLSSSQIKKCILNFLETFKMESNQDICLKESRLFTSERLAWCISKLYTVTKYLDDHIVNGTLKLDCSGETFVTPMYFVNWIDYTFDVLSKLACSIYRTDYKDNEKLNVQWKDNMVEHITSLHMCVDELLLSAMTLCKYCLDEDQPALKARCHVVLRETKALFSELVNVDITKSVKITPHQLKLPIMPSNVNILIDVLKDVLYVLETNTNTALLTLLIHCYVYCISPVDVLRDHFSQKKEQFCPCSFANVEDVDIETCKDVKSFDLYNERLLQIGSFAVSCSSDQKRILSLRSCLSSLECLDPHLVPAISTDQQGAHTTLLMNFWKQEVKEIRDTVFLIVDPVAFVERCKLYMKDLLLTIERQNSHEICNIWAVVINIGSVVFKFFSTYKKYEPDALIPNIELDTLLDNLDQARKECRLVFDYLTKYKTSKDNIEKGISNRKITYDTLSMRVKLLYSLVKKIHELFLPKDDDQLFAYEEEVPMNRNLTHTILNPHTVCSHRNLGANMTRSMFARTAATVEKGERNGFLNKLTRHLNVKKDVQVLNFSAQVSELFQVDMKEVTPLLKAPTEDVSMRRELLCQYRSFPFMRKLNSTFDIEKNEENQRRVIDLNDTASLQISAILNQINDITDIVSTTASRRKNTLPTTNKVQNAEIGMSSKNVVLDHTTSTSITSNVTQPSNVTTLERISDLDLVESKLYSLKKETKL